MSDSSYETVITNLDEADFPPEELKRLYGMRWGIETSFRKLKHTVGLLHFHAKKVESITREIFAGLIMYSFSELTVSHVVIQKQTENILVKQIFLFRCGFADNSFLAMYLHRMLKLRSGGTFLPFAPAEAILAIWAPNTPSASSTEQHNSCFLNSLFCGFFNSLTCHALFVEKVHPSPDALVLYSGSQSLNATNLVILRPRAALSLAV